MSESTVNAPSRRKVAQGIAWSVPVIATASLAPLAAASPLRCPSVTPGGSGDPCGLNAQVYTKINYTHVLDANSPYLEITQRLQVLLPVGTTLTTGQSITLTIDIGGVTTGIIPSAILDPAVSQLDVTVTKTSINSDTGTRLEVVITAKNNYTFSSAIYLLLTVRIPLGSLAVVNPGGVLGQGITIQLVAVSATGASGCGGTGSILNIPIPLGNDLNNLTQLRKFVSDTVGALINTGLNVCLPLGLGNLVVNLNL